MRTSLRIAVADDEPRVLEYYQEVLVRLSHRVTHAARTGRELIEACSGDPPDLIISDIRMPDMDGIDAVREICREAPIPAILISAYHDPNLYDRAQEEHILAYLVKPIKQEDLEAAIQIALQRFEQFRKLHQETGELRQAMADRKLIERAKGILMKKAQLDEGQAFLRLQKLARDSNQKLAAVSQILINAECAFQPQDHSPDR